MKLMVVSLCTQGVMREHFIYYCRKFATKNKVYCITNDNITNEELGAIETLNLSYKRNNPFGYFSPGKLWRFKKYLDKVKPDIVYIFTHHATSLLIPPILKKYNVVYQIHDPIPHIGVGKLNSWIIRKQVKVYSNIAKKMIVAGKDIKKQVLENYVVDADKIEVIPFAVLDNYINDDVDAINKNVDLLFFGRIEPYKGIDILIRALDLLEIKPETYIVGSGDICEIHPEIEKIPQNVHVLGYLENNELIAYLKTAKIVVLPYREATGTMTVCQCYYYGKPVIASNVGVFPEYVSTGGIIFETNNVEQLATCIEKLLADEAMQNELSNNAKKIYEQMFTMQNACEMHQKIFESIV